jgi:Na+:H+ antiporter, NhaC family
MTEGTRPVRDPSLVDAVIPLVTLAVLIAGSLALFVWTRSTDRSRSP